MAALNAAWWGNHEAGDYWLRNLHSWALRADIHVFIQTFLVRGVREFRNRQYSEAESALRKGTKFAGDNGFLLEWLDMQVLRAAIAFTQRDMDLASQYSKLVLEGDRSTYLVPLEGAAHKQVSYWFAAMPAYFIFAKANNSNAVYPSSLSENAEDMFPSLSNVLLRAIQNDI